MNCSGKIAIIAGGLGGIGYATCKSLLAKELAIFDIAENLDLIKKLSEKYSSGNVKFWKVDVTKRDEIDASFKAVRKDFGCIDILVTSVGVLDEFNPKRCIEINLTGTLHLNYAAIDNMSTSKGGKGGIVANVASISGIHPYPLAIAYSSSKAGMVGLTRSLGTDFYLKTTGIRFIAICPGYTSTSLIATFPRSPINDFKEFPKKNFILQTAEDCGEHLVAALEENKNGSVWMIDGGKMKEIISPCYYDLPNN